MNRVVDGGTASRWRALRVGSWAVGWVKKRLDLAAEDTRLLTARCDLEQGYLFTYVPVNVPHGRLRQPALGGIVSGQLQQDGTLVLSDVPRQMLGKYIAQQLRRQRPAVVLAENLTDKPNDPFLIESRPTSTLIRDGTVYHWLKDIACPGEIADLISWVDLAYPPALVLVMKNPIECSQYSAHKVFDILVEAGEVKVIAVGAYDGESFIVWKSKWKHSDTCSVAT